MSPDLVEFWIITHAGIPIFYYSPNAKQEPTLIGGFFSAIQEMAKAMGGNPQQIDDYVEQLSLGKVNLTFLSNSKYQLFFIVKTKKNLKAKKIQTHLQNIEELFIKQFEAQLVNFPLDPSLFDSFLNPFLNYFNDKKMLSK